MMDKGIISFDCQSIISVIDNTVQYLEHKAIIIVLVIETFYNTILQYLLHFIIKKLCIAHPRVKESICVTISHQDPTFIMILFTSIINCLFITQNYPHLI